MSANIDNNLFDVDTSIFISKLDRQISSPQLKIYVFFNSLTTVKKCLMFTY